MIDYPAAATAKGLVRQLTEIDSQKYVHAVLREFGKELMLSELVSIIEGYSEIEALYNSRGGLLEKMQDLIRTANAQAWDGI